MKKQLLLATVTTMLLAGTSLSFAQMSEKGSSPSAPSASPAAPGGASEKGAPSATQAPSGSKSSPGAMGSQSNVNKGNNKADQAQAPAAGGKSNGAKETQAQTQTPSKSGSDHNAASEKSDRSSGSQAQTSPSNSSERNAADTKSNRSSGSEAQSSPSKSNERNAADSKSETNVNVSLSTEERSNIRKTVISQSNAPRMNRSDINFTLNVGTVVPRSVHVAILPAAVIEIHPAWRGYQYLLVGDEIVILEPGTLRIIAIIPA